MCGITGIFSFDGSPVDPALLEAMTAALGHRGPDGSGRLLNGPVGLAGNRCMASIFFITAHKMDKARRQSALDAARAVIDLHLLRPMAGATSPNDRVVVVRVLAPVVEPVMHLLKQVRAAWRAQLWDLTGDAPRVWTT